MCVYVCMYVSMCVCGVGGVCGVGCVCVWSFYFGGIEKRFEQ